MLKKLIRLPFDLTGLLVTYWPGSLGYSLRYYYWKRKLKYLGKNVQIDVGVYFQKPECISIGNNSWIDRNVVILAGADKSNRKSRYISNPNFSLSTGEVCIGENVHIGVGVIISGIGGVFIAKKCCLSAGAKVYSFSHHYKSIIEPERTDIHFGSQGAYDDQFMIEGPITLGENVGVGFGAIILPGVNIGYNSFVAIQSVILQSFPENSFIQGNPGKKIKSRFKENLNE